MHAEAISVEDVAGVLTAAQAPELGEIIARPEATNASDAVAEANNATEAAEQELWLTYEEIVYVFICPFLL